MPATRDPAILRSQALALMREAQSIDGLRPFLVIHEHKGGGTPYIAWATSEPTVEQAASILESEFEPEREEFLTVDDSLRLEEMTGTAPSSIIEPAAPERQGSGSHAPHPSLS